MKNIQHFMPRLTGLRLMLVFTLLLLTVTSCVPGKSPFARYEIGGDFTLIDKTGSEFSLSDLKGKYVLLFFGYTQCPDACPFALSKIGGTYNMLGEKKSKDLVTVFVSVDHERDNPKTIGAYFDSFSFPVIGLTGTKEEIAKAAELYGATYEKVETDSAMGYLIDHSTLIYLIDANGDVRFVFHHNDPVPKMKTIIATLMKMGKK